MQIGKTVRCLDAWVPRRVLISTVWIFAGAYLIGQAEGAPTQPQTELMVRTWSVTEGLPHGSVTALAQTRDGYLWIGTLAGLVRFDGVRFKIFTPQNCPELPRSPIGRLFEGADGTLARFALPVQLMVSLGAGIYEELLFRVLLVAGLAALARRGFGWKPFPAGAFAAITGALIFSAFHYVGPLGDPWALGSFTFRAVAGLLFSGLYLLRGFGVTAWSHALYDVFLAVGGGWV